ncbi:hypothetical protein XENTR_v10000973 [Xenopus tropicalis]|nr:hypothetical protein XENTR_v10000973 [Xenopus tropicalis]
MTEVIVFTQVEFCSLHVKYEYYLSLIIQLLYYITMLDENQGTSMVLSALWYHVSLFFFIHNLQKVAFGENVKIEKEKKKFYINIFDAVSLESILYCHCFLY